MNNYKPYKYSLNLFLFRIKIVISYYLELSKPLKTTRRSLFIIIFLLIFSNSFGQLESLYLLDNRLINGDKNALFQIASYFDDSNTVTDHLGYHLITPKVSNVAKRIVLENCFFTKDEIKITDSTTTKQFSEFLNKNKDKITFSELANAFISTPFENRDANFEVQELASSKKQDLLKDQDKLLTPEWITENKIDSFIKIKDPYCLLLIAYEYVKERDRFNSYNHNKKEFYNLLQYLTGVVIAVEDVDKKLTREFDWDYQSVKTLNLLIFFAKHYHEFVWDEKKAIFVNPTLKIKLLTKEELLFETLKSSNDSLALDAYIQLTTCDPIIVTQLATECDINDFDVNYSLPTFPFRFIKQLVLLTDYCKTNNIDFIGSSELRKNISLLDFNLSFAERRKLEDKLINTLKLEEITAFEYWALINEESWGLTYSAGRILDIFYSKNWGKLLQDNKQLECYLIKSKLYNNLGIIGICNNYLKKFQNSSPDIIEKLKNYQTSNETIKKVLNKIISNDTIKTKKQSITKFESEANRDYIVTDLKDKLIKLTTNVTDSSKSEEAITKILSQICYQQIDTALILVENFKFKLPQYKYIFMERDWGFSFIINFDKKNERDEFIKLYSTLTEYQLYAYYLDKARIVYKNEDNTFNYDKIYDMFKYDIVTAFVGGGGGSQDNETYMLIKLLELTYNTTLGFPHKLCNSNNIYGCTSEDRAKAWMDYFKKNNLLKHKHDEPVSFHEE